MGPCSAYSFMKIIEERGRFGDKSIFLIHHDRKAIKIETSKAIINHVKSSRGIKETNSKYTSLIMHMKHQDRKAIKIETSRSKENQDRKAPNVSHIMHMKCRNQIKIEKSKCRKTMPTHSESFQ